MEVRRNGERYRGEEKHKNGENMKDKSALGYHWGITYSIVSESEEENISVAKHFNGPTKLVTKLVRTVSTLEPDARR